jgi:hypothetical protein
MEKDYKKMYEDALEKAKQQLYIAECNKDEGKVWYLKYMFTELRESEDEKIRKELINFFSKGAEFDSSTNGIKDRNIIAWLERQCKQKSQGKLALEVWKDMRFEVYQQASGNRHEPNYSDDSTKMFSLTDIDEIFEKVAEKQGEQESTDEVKPKFKIGDWITNGECTWNVTDIHIQPLDYTLQSPNGVVIYDAISYVDEHFHLWTIQDAKDSDVLLFEGYYNSIVLFQGIGINGKGRINYHCKCDLGNYSFGIQGDVACLGTIEKDAEHYHPATKEQRDLLFQKMREAGYEWDAEKKGLKKIEQESTCWNEEDERWFKELELMALSFSNDVSYRKKFFDWLKSIKYKKNQYNKDKKIIVDWNEKIKGLDELETYILSLDPNRSLEAVKIDAKNICFLVNKDENKYDKGFNDGFSASEYNKILTEEDIRHIDNIICCLEEFTRPGFPIYKGNVFKEIKWLENLKNNK